MCYNLFNHKQLGAHMHSIVFYQEGQLYLNLSVPLDLACHNPLEALRRLFWSLDYRCFTREKKVSGRPHAITARQMVFILVYARLHGCFSSREVEALCQRDLVCIHVLEGRKAPDHSTIDRFIRMNGEAIRNIFAQSVKKLDGQGELKREIAFIDGTKVESKAGKYTFVWLKAIEKNLPKLIGHIRKLYGEYLLHYDLEATIDVCDEQDARAALAIMFRKIDLDKPVKRGRGHHLPFEARLANRLVEYAEKLDRYVSARDRMRAEHRKSMSKTDADATFMRMKEDYMRNGQLKPAYNIQNIVDSGYIVSTYCSRDRTDYHTLVPAMEQVVHRLGFQYQGVCADSGYDCVENYRYLDEQKMIAYIKTQTFEQSRKRSFGKDPGSKFAMTYEAKHDQLRCINNTILHNTGRKRYGATVYQAKRGCVGCRLRSSCMKSQASRSQFKQIQYHPEAEAFRLQALQNITNGKGVELRVNRSIQAEGSFSLIKDGLGIRRFLHKGLLNVETEWILLCMATNTLKLQNKINAGTVGIPSWYYINNTG